MEMTGVCLVCEAQCIVSPWSPWSVFQNVLLTASCCLSKEMSLFLPSPFSFSPLSHRKSLGPSVRWGGGCPGERGQWALVSWWGLVQQGAAGRTFLRPALGRDVSRKFGGRKK